MISQKKLEANRRNAAHSTGPTSDEGKAVASHNSLKHGMYASNPLLPQEDPAEFDAFRDGLVRHLRPRTPMEQLLVDRIVCNAWRLRRIGEIENWVITRKQQVDGTGYFSGHRHGADQSPTEVMAAEFMWSSKAFEQLSLHEQRLQRSMQAALRQLLQLQKQSRDEEEADAQEDSRKTGNEPTDACKRITTGDLGSAPGPANPSEIATFRGEIPERSQQSLGNGRQRPAQAVQCTLSPPASNLARFSTS